MDAPQFRARVAHGVRVSDEEKEALGKREEEQEKEVTALAPPATVPFSPHPHVITTRTATIAITTTTTGHATKQALLACVLCAVWLGVMGGVMTLSDRYAHQNVWSGVQKSGDDQFW